MPSPRAPEPHPVTDRIRHLRSVDRRVRWIGLSISVGIHLVLGFLYSGIAGPPTLRVSPRAGESTTGLTGIELLNLIEEAEAEPEEEADRPEETEVVPTLPLSPLTPRPTDRPTGRRATEEGGGRQTVEVGPLGPAIADRLRVRTYDERLWDFGREIYEPTVERRLTSELAGRIDLWADSLAAALERDARSTDWTWTDAEGNRWGVSPGKLHLGSLTLPLPFGFGIPPGRFEEYMERQYIDRELARNALTGVILQTWQDRAEAIKRRRDRERAEAAENSGPRRIIPDTARAGGGG
jgi:hypothetical protein